MHGKAEKISAPILIAMGLAVSIYAYKYLKLGLLISPGAGFMPFFLGILMMIFGGVWFIQTMMARTACEEAPSATLWKKLLIGVIILIVYAWLFERIGYILSTAFYMLVWQKVVEREKWLNSIIITSLSAAAMYLLFSGLLKVPLPGGEWLQ